MAFVEKVKLTHVKPHEIVKTANGLFNQNSFFVTLQCAHLGNLFVKGDVQVVPKLVVLFCVEILRDKVCKNRRILHNFIDGSYIFSSFELGSYRICKTYFDTEIVDIFALDFD